MLLVPSWTYLGPPDSNFSGPMKGFMGLILHIAEGSYLGTISWMKNPISDVSSHTVHGHAGERAQMLDINLTAWTQSNGNGWWVSVEHEGFNYEALTPEQLESTAQLYAWLVQNKGVPLQLTDSPDVPGLGWHGMGGSAWGGHPNCPGEPIKAQRPAILARAEQILNNGGTTPPPNTRRSDVGILMVAKSGAGPSGETTDHSRWWAGDGIYHRELPDESAANFLIGAIQRFYGDPRALILSWGDASPEVVQGIIGPIPAGTGGGGGLTFNQAVEAARQGANEAEDS
jgi:hypothetical protein